MGVPVRFQNLQTRVGDQSPALVPGLQPRVEAGFTARLGPAEADALAALGLSLRAYAGYHVALDVALAFISGVIGLFIFWRRPDDWLTLWVSLLLVGLGTNSVSLIVPTLITVWPGSVLVSTVAGLLGMVGNVHILFLSPDGRFVPRWTMPLAAGFTGGMLALGAYVGTRFEQLGMLGSMGYFGAALPVWVALLSLGVYSQVYRYRVVSGLVQRQQTKWVVVGLAACALGFIVNAALLFAAGQASGQARVLYNLARTPIVNALMLFLPVCVGLSILRYRLWDIDVLIRRTLIYSSLTALLVVVYLALVVVLQALWGTLTGQQRQSDLVTVLSTLAIATLFIPLRRRVQAFIDRSFFRRKYDAAQVLAAFGDAVREETDLARLAERLVSVVDETMQPAPIGLWLKPLEQPNTTGQAPTIREPK